MLLQLGAHPLLQPRGVLDDAVYTELARRVAGGDLALAPGVYFLAPFYTYWLGLVFALSGGSIFAARLVQVLLGTACVWLILETATAWFGKRAGLWAGGLAALTGLFAFNEILILQSSIDPFLTALALFALTRAVQSTSTRPPVAAGLSMAALSLNRPNALPAVAAVALTWLVARRSRTGVRQTLAFVLGALALLSPVAIRNRVVAGEWTLVTSHGGLNFYIGNHAGADGTWKLVPGIEPSVAGQAEDAERVASEALGRPVSASEASSYFYEEAWRFIRSSPGVWMKLLLRKAALTLSAADPALNYSYTYYARDESTLLSFLVVGPWILLPLGVFGLALGPRAGAYGTWVAFTPAYALSLVAFFVSSRYRLPLLVPLLVGSGAAADWLIKNAARRLTVAIAALAPLFALAHWPLAVDDGRMNEREERIVQLIDDGSMEDGERLLQDTESRHPAPALMLFRVGLVYLGRGDAERAVAHLERALAQRDEPAIRLGLGEALLAANRPEDAAVQLDAARTAGFEPVRSAFGATEAYLAQGKEALARDILSSIPVSPELDAALLLDLGKAALRAQDAALAERFFRESLARTPTLAAAHEQLGIALGTRGKTGEAARELETAVGLDATSASERFFLALAYFQQGDRRQARAQAEHALRLKPDYREAIDLLSRLDKR